MILGRPTNLWLGAFAAVFNALVIVAQQQGNTFFTPVLVAAINLAAASVITLIATHPPTIQSGDQVTVAGHNGTASRKVTVE